MDYVFYLLLQKAKKDLNQQEIENWINAKTDEDGYTALHYASWKGSIQILKMLIENGADKYCKNECGLDCLHIAAQSNQAISLYYFKTLKMNLVSRSIDDLTPLHWACFNNSEVAMLYLLAWVSVKHINL